MKIFKNVFLVFILLVITVGCQEQKEEVKKVTDWNNPESIDPLKPDIGNFMDIDTREYFIKADEAYRNKQYQKAAKYYLAVLRNDITDVIALYNLSCSYGLLNKPELSARYLLKSVENGFTDFNYIQQDSDFFAVKNHEKFKQTLDSVKFLINNLGEMQYLESKSINKFRLKLPDDYNQNKKYPLVVGLHGYAGNQDQFVRLWKHFFIPQFIFASPQAPYHIPIGKMEEYRWFIEESGEEIVQKSRDVSDNFVLDVISKTRRNYDVGNVYLLAFHDGVEIAMDLAVKYPKMIKGLILLNGRLDTTMFSKKQLEKANKIKVLMTIAEKNQDHRRENKIIYNKLKEAGFEITTHSIKQEDTLTKPTLTVVQNWLDEEIRK